MSVLASACALGPIPASALTQAEYAAKVQEAEAREAARTAARLASRVLAQNQKDKSVVLPSQTTSVVVPAGPGRWSDPATWGGVVPSGSSEVVIPAGRTIILDKSPAPLVGLRIEGTLTFADEDLHLSVGYIQVKGALNIGTFSAPFTHKAVITLTGTPGQPSDALARGITVQGGQLTMYGTTRWPVWTKLHEHAAAGANAFTLDQAVNWQAGDSIVIAPTTFYGQSDTEKLTLASVSGTALSTTSGLKAGRWGKLQYVTNNGMSLTPDASYVPPQEPAPRVLDERAAVGNVSRNIVIEGADDSYWSGQGFGAHLQIQGLASKVAINAVEFRRVGQAGKLGKYPLHWDMLSYDPSSGAELGDATGHVIQNSAIWSSANRCVVLQGTNGVTVKNNICFDIKGHAFMTEDAVERRNVFDANLALRMRAAAPAQVLKAHEQQGFEIGPSGFWISNPDNTITNNLGADAQGNGLWFSIPFKALGRSRAVPLFPRYIPLKLVENNTVHSARGPGQLMEWVPVDDNVPNPEATKGTIIAQKYLPMSKGKPCLNAQGAIDDWCNDRVRFTVKRTTSFKNLGGAYRNRVSQPDYVEWMVGDNVAQAFAGAADDGVIERALLVGYSLNHTTTSWPYGAAPPAGLATYHSAVDMKNNTFVNFPQIQGYTSGAFSADDYYLSGVERGTVRNVGNLLINSSPGYRNLQPGLQARHNPAENWALSGAIWDVEGLWGPKGWYTVPNVPFLTSGAKCVDAVPVGSNGKSCEGEYYGVSSLQTDFDDSRFLFGAAINVSRQDASGREVGTWRIEDGYSKYSDPAVAAAYNCSTGITPPAGHYCSWKLGQMRHFAARQDGRYVLSFPGRKPARWVALYVGNAYRASDTFLMAVSFDGRLTASGYEMAGAQYQREWPMYSASMRGQSNVRVFKAGTSLAEVVVSDGSVMWQDRANNLVWFKHRGGLVYPNEAGLTVNSGDYLYRYYSVVLYPAAECLAAGNLGNCLNVLRALP
ncbi:MAG: G8 domain-containing protein [Burkholderiales bacterium]